MRATARKRGIACIEAEYRRSTSGVHCVQAGVHLESIAQAGVHLGATARRRGIAHRRSMFRIHRTSPVEAPFQYCRASDAQSGQPCANIQGKAQKTRHLWLLWQRRITQCGTHWGRVVSVCLNPGPSTRPSAIPAHLLGIACSSSMSS